MHGRAFCRSLRAGRELERNTVAVGGEATAHRGAGESDPAGVVAGEQRSELKLSRAGAQEFTVVGVLHRHETFRFLHEQLDSGIGSQRDGHGKSSRQSGSRQQRDDGPGFDLEPGFHMKTQLLAIKSDRAHVEKSRAVLGDAHRPVA